MEKVIVCDNDPSLMKKLVKLKISECYEKSNSL